MAQPQPQPQPTCLTCAQPLSTIAPTPATEKPRLPRRTPCCDRTICGPCQRQNPRFETYCPICQIASAPSSLPQGLRDPPGYEESEGENKRRARMRAQRLVDEAQEEPPAYSEAPTGSGRRGGEGEDVTHHLRPEDTVQSISLAYGVPLQVLRTHNGLYSDHLLSARYTLLIPASHYQGPSLSAEPVESEEERERKARLRRFMMRTKCTDYGMSEVYLRDAKDDLEKAVAKWEDDEKWERENPMKKSNGSSRRRGVGGGLTGQLG